MFRQFLEQQEIFVFFVTVYGGAGLIAQRSPRQRAADLSVEAADARRVRLRQARDSDGVAAAGHVGAGDPAAGRADRVRRQRRRSSGATSTCFRRSPSSRSSRSMTVSAAMLALSSLSNSSRYVGILYAALLFFSQALFGVLRLVTGSTRLSWISVPVEPRRRSATRSSGCRSRTTRRGRSSLADDRRPGRGVGRSCSSGACAASRSSRDGRPADRRRRPSVEVVRPGDRAERRDGDGAAGHHRSARPERRRQVHVPEADHRSAEAEQRRRHGARRADLGQSRALRPHRILPGAGRVLRADDRARVGDARSCG